MGDAATFAVHRCRFVDFTPSAVTAITFPPLSLPSTKGKSPEIRSQPLKFGILAVGRANGNIELCEWTGKDRQTQAPQAWVVQRVCVHVQILIRQRCDESIDISWPLPLESRLSSFCFA